MRAVPCQGAKSAAKSQSSPSSHSSISPSTRFQLPRVRARRNFDDASQRRTPVASRASSEEAAAAPHTRRSLLLSSAASAAIASVALLAPLQAAFADEGAAEAAASSSSSPSSSSSLFVPDLRELPLPEAYVETSRALIKSLRDAIEADLSDADESKVRRKAEPAKASVREWTSRWGDGRAPAVGGSASHSALTAALRELGGFYSKRGQRARLDRETAGRLMGELDEAERGLPAEKEKKRGLFSLT